jgi:hypothetical protein
MTPAAFQFIVSAITDVDGNDGTGPPMSSSPPSLP